MNPTLWVAYEKIGKLGENVMPNRVFNESKLRHLEKKTTIPSAKKKK